MRKYNEYFFTARYLMSQLLVDHCTKAFILLASVPVRVPCNMHFRVIDV